MTNNPIKNRGKDSNRHYTKQDAHEKKLNIISLEMQVKATLRCHFPALKQLFYILEINNSKCWWGQRNGNPHTFGRRKLNDAATLEYSWQILKKLHINLSYNPEIALFGTYPNTTTTTKNIHPHKAQQHVNAESIIHNHQKLETT